MATAFRNMQGRFVGYTILACDVNSGKTSEYINLENVAHVQLHVICQAMAGATNMTINRAKTVAGGSAATWTGWDYVFARENFSTYDGEDSSHTKDFTRTAVSSYTKALSTANSEYVIEIDPIQIGIADGWNALAVAFSNPSASDIISVVAYLEMQVQAETPPDPFTQ